MSQFVDFNDKNEEQVLFYDEEASTNIDNNQETIQ